MGKAGAVGVAQLGPALKSRKKLGAERAALYVVLAARKGFEYHSLSRSRDMRALLRVDKIQPKKTPLTTNMRNVSPSSRTPCCLLLEQAQT